MCCCLDFLCAECCPRPVLTFAATACVALLFAAGANTLVAFLVQSAASASTSHAALFAYVAVACGATALSARAPCWCCTLSTWCATAAVQGCARCCAQRARRVRRCEGEVRVDACSSSSSSRMNAHLSTSDHVDSPQQRHELDSSEWNYRTPPQPLRTRVLSWFDPSVCVQAQAGSGALSASLHAPLLPTAQNKDVGTLLHSHCANGAAKASPASQSANAHEPDSIEPPHGVASAHEGTNFGIEQSPASLPMDVSLELSPSSLQRESSSECALAHSSGALSTDALLRPSADREQKTQLRMLLEQSGF